MGTVATSPVYVNAVAGENYSGAEAWLQVYNLAAAPTSENPLYSFSAADHGVVSEVLPGYNPTIPGRLLSIGYFVGWSSDASTYVPVVGSINVQGQYK